MRRTIAPVLLATAAFALAGCTVQAPAPSTSPTTAASATPATPTSAAPDVTGSATPATTVRPATGKAACRKAIKAQYDPDTLQLKGKPGRPAECAGLSTDEVSALAVSVIDELSK